MDVSLSSFNQLLQKTQLLSVQLNQTNVFPLCLGVPEQVHGRVSEHSVIFFSEIPRDNIEKLYSDMNLSGLKSTTTLMRQLC